MISCDVSLRGLNSFGIECVAGELFSLCDEADLTRAWEWLSDNPGALVLGGGTNVLLATESLDAVLRVQLSGRKIAQRNEQFTLIEVGAGENWHELVRWTLDNDMSGLENLSLIPGTCGAAPVQNIGAYGVELASLLDSVKALNLNDGQLCDMTREECQFGYRDSLFKHQPGQWMITRIRLRLPNRPALNLDYAPLRDYLREQKVTDPSPRDVSDAVCAIRRSKLPDPAVLGNAGSFFKNPVVSGAVADQLLAESPDMPHWHQPQNGQVKLSAGWLIEQTGMKGWRSGDAGVHEQHALVLVNYGQATGAQLQALAQQIQRRVREQFNLALEPEPVILDRASV